MMRLIGPAATLAALVWVVTPVHAEPPVRAPRLHITNILARSHQALAFDASANEYRLLRVGERMPGFTVTEITDDFVVLASTERPGWHFVLSMPKPLPPPPEQTPPAPTDDGVLDPYLDAPQNQPIDPYAPAPAPAAPPERNLDVLDPYSAAPRSAPAPGLPAFPAPTPSGSPPYAISRGELNQAMSDFQEIEREVQLQPTEHGVQVIGLSAGSFLHRLGLRQGDLVLRVAGKPIHTADGAAAAYAAVSSSERFDVVVFRRGREITLRYEITP